MVESLSLFKASIVGTTSAYCTSASVLPGSMVPGHDATKAV